MNYFTPHNFFWTAGAKGPIWLDIYVPQSSKTDVTTPNCWCPIEKPQFLPDRNVTPGGG